MNSNLSKSNQKPNNKSAFNSSNSNMNNNYSINNFNKENTARTNSTNFNYNNNKLENKLINKAVFNSTIGSNFNPVKLANDNIASNKIAENINDSSINRHNAYNESVDLTKKSSLINEHKANNLKQTIPTNNSKRKIPQASSSISSLNDITKINSNINGNNKSTNFIKLGQSNSNANPYIKQGSIMAEVNLTENSEHKRTITIQNDSLLKEKENYKLKLLNAKYPSSEKSSVTNINNILKNNQLSNSHIKNRLSSGVNSINKIKNQINKNMTNSNFYTPYINKSSTKFLEQMGNSNIASNNATSNINKQIAKSQRESKLKNTSSNFNSINNFNEENNINEDTISHDKKSYITKKSSLYTSRPLVKSVINLNNPTDRRAESTIENNHVYHSKYIQEITNTDNLGNDGTQGVIKLQYDGNIPISKHVSLNKSNHPTNNNISKNTSSNFFSTNKAGITNNMNNFKNNKSNTIKSFVSNNLNNSIKDKEDGGSNNYNNNDNRINISKIKEINLASISKNDYSINSKISLSKKMPKKVIIHKTNLSTISNPAKMNIQDILNNQVNKHIEINDYSTEKKTTITKGVKLNPNFNSINTNTIDKKENFYTYRDNNNNNIDTNGNIPIIENNNNLHSKINGLKNNHNNSNSVQINSVSNLIHNNASLINQNNQYNSKLSKDHSKKNSIISNPISINSSLYQNNNNNNNQIKSIPKLKDNLPQKIEKVDIEIKEKNNFNKNKYNSQSPESTWVKVSTKDTKDKEDTFENINKSFESNFSKLKENLIYQKESQKLSKTIRSYYSKNNEYPKTDLSFYKIGRFLGKGAFGKVNLGLHILSGRLVAIKSFNKKKIEIEKLKRKIAKETNVLKSLHHIHVVKIYETFETEKFFMIAMEYISCGDLLSYVRKRSRLTEPIAKYIFKQIIMALKYIHYKGISHRDIKLDNILIDINSNIKVCDFGVAKKMTKGEMMTDQCGTPAYIAPEVFKGNGYDGSLSDVWSSGVVLYAMLAGTVPFKASKLNELKKVIISCNYNKIKGISEEAEDLLSKILETDPNKRLTSDQILEHPWMNFNEATFKNNFDLFTQSEKIHLSNSNLDFRYADPKEIVEVFTYKNLDTIVKCENSKTKSVILAPFNSSLNDIENDSFVNYICSTNIKQEINMSFLIDNNIYKELDVLNNAIKFDPKVKASNKIYELNNNGEIDNGIIISPKGLSKNNTNDSDDDKQKKKYMSNINSKINSKLNSMINSPVPEREDLIHTNSNNQLNLTNKASTSKFYSNNILSK